VKKILFLGISALALGLGTSAYAGQYHKGPVAYPYKPIPNTPCFDGAQFIDGVCVTVNETPTFVEKATCKPGEQKRVNGHIYTCGFVRPQDPPPAPVTP
jgi:hypothetical protein